MSRQIYAGPFLPLSMLQGQKWQEIVAISDTTAGMVNNHLFCPAAYCWYVTYLQNQINVLGTVPQPFSIDIFTLCSKN